MIANNYFSMNALIDLSVTKLFLLAEYVCDKTLFGLRPQFSTANR